MSLNDEIKKYIVKITYKENSEGSGVIVNTKNDNYFYILTAKHTFFTYTDNEKMDENEILKEKIKIVNSKNKNLLLSIENIIGIDKKYDFLVLVVKKDNQINDIEPLSIYEDDFKECKICGYPNSKIKDDNKAILLPCSYNIRHEEKSTYEVNSNILLEAIHPDLNANKKMKGISGSGVFVESATGKLYLAGIQIQTASHNSLVCLDIRILAREINDALEKKEYLPIEIDGYVIKDELGINTDDLDFGEMLNDLKDKEFDKDNLKDRSYEDLINIFNGKIKQELSTKSKELANKYLYLSLLFHREKDNRRSTIYFKKAVKNNPSYYALFLKAKDERDEVLTDKQKEKYDEINREVSSSDISADDLFLEMLEERLEKLEEFDEKEGVYIQMIKLLETQLRELDKREEIEEKKEEIFKKSIKLFKLYMKEDKLDDADNILLELKDKKYDVENYLYELYIKEEFIDKSSSSKQELSKRYLDLLNNFKDDEEKFERLREQLDLLYNDETDGARRELNGVKEQIKKYKEQINSLEDMFTKYIKEEKVLENVKSQIKESHTKLDNISDTIKKNHDFLIQMLLNGVIETNKELVIGVQKIYKNSNINEKLVQTLNSTITYMKQRVKILPSQGNKQPDITDIETIIKNCNYTLYKGIKKLYEDNTDSEKNYLFKKAISLAEKRHQEHLVSLKKSLEDKKLEIKLSDKIDKYSNKIDNYSNNIDKKLNIIIGTIKKTNNKRIDNILENICNSNRALVSKIQTMYHQNDRVNKKAKIALKESIEEINEKLNSFPNENQIEKIIKDSNWNFYQSIKGLCESEQDSYNHKLLEMSIAFTKREHELHIEKLEQDIVNKDSKIKKLEKINPKNQKRLRKFFKKVKASEKTLEEIRVNTSLPIYRLYCLVRNILLGGIVLGALVIFELNYKTLISEIEFSKILTILKNLL